MKRRCVTALLLSMMMGNTPLAAFAQDGAAEHNKQSNVVIPARKIQFKMVTEPYAMELPRVDPELLEQKFIAEIRLKPVSAAKDWSSPFGSKTVLGRLCHYVGGPSLFLPLGGHDTWESAPDYFEALIANVPNRERPPEDILNFFLQHSGEPLLTFVSLSSGSRGVKRGVRRALAVDDDKQTWDHFSFFVLAPTESRAKQLSEGLLTLFDQGLSRFGQEAALTSRAENEVQLREAQQASEQAEETLRDRTKALKAASAIDATALAEFVIRQHLLDVDLAGSHARVDATNKILASGGGAMGGLIPPARQAQVEGLKIAAEIELVGLIARKKALASLISAGKTRATIGQEVAKATVECDALNSRIEACRRGSQRYARDFQALAPFELVDGIVLIRPLRWESSEKGRGRR